MLRTPGEQAVRRRELYQLPVARLQTIYGRVSGHLAREVRSDWPTDDPRSQRALVDLIVARESR